MAQNRIETLLEAANSSPQHDTSVNSARRTFLSENDAIKFFKSVRENLFRISEWRKNSTATSYDLFDASGQPSNSDTIDLGKFIRIKLHGSGKHDWVHVEEIADEPDATILRVKPSHDPTDPDRSDSTSHFFGPEAENNFCVQRDEKSVVFYVIGLNERQNTKDADGLVESARNAAVANIGYYSGLQKAVWKDFATNFLRTDREKSE
jgi:hypothetical protein